jgi:hypothetical protein
MRLVASELGSSNAEAFVSPYADALKGVLLDSHGLLSDG